MIRAGLRRILALLAIVVGGTAAVSAAIGAVAGKNVVQALAIGFYVVGAAVLIGSFGFGSRGPRRIDRSVDPERPSGGLRQHSSRRATPEERRESKLISLGLFVLGLLLVLLGAGLDPSRHAF